MNGVHDMGGMHNFGPVEPEENEPVFHEDWERRTFGVALLCYGAFGITEDEFRYAIERMPAAEYLGSSYYEHWLSAFETLGMEKGVFSDDELEATQRGRKSAAGAAPKTGRRVIRPGEIEPIMRVGGTKRRPEAHAAPRFKVGQEVLTRNDNPETHTRLPRYARGKRGVIERDHGPYVYPDSNAELQGENPQRLYSVRFTALGLWGSEASEKDCVYLDLFEPYLAPA